MYNMLYYCYCVYKDKKYKTHIIFVFAPLCDIIFLFLKTFYLLSAVNETK